MANIAYTDVQLAGDWDDVEAPQATLEGAAFIAAGDGWLNEILELNGLTTLAALTTVDANRGALAKAAEIFYVAGLFAGRPSKEDFTAGPIKSSRVRQEEKRTAMQMFFKIAEEMLDKAGLYVRKWTATSKGGDEYHPEGDDDTQIDFGIAAVQPDEDFNLLGVEEE
jgi:hypothetical protein